jgi:hypothetical protein
LAKSNKNMNDNKVLSVFRRLSRRKCRLMPICGGSAPRRYGIEVDGVAPKAAEIGEEVLRGWLADGRIEPCDGGYRIAAAGLSWLRRRLAEGDGFQEQHQPRTRRVIDFEGARQPAIVSEPESPLRWLASRKDKSGVPLLAPFQLEAGERLRSDYEFAGITARVTSCWDSGAGGGGESSGQNAAAALQDNVMAARQRVTRAIAAVGPELCGVLLDVCCHAKGLEEAEKAEGWPQRSGKVVLQIALTRLARHYGLISEEQLGKAARRKLQQWGAAGYRPSIDGDEEAC